MKNYLAKSNPDLGPITGFSSGISAATTDAPTRIANILSGVVATITIFGGVAFTFWFIIGAITWITGGDDPQLLEKAKKQMSSAIVGLIILIVALPIAYTLGKIAGIDILGPETIIQKVLPQ